MRGRGTKRTAVTLANEAENSYVAFTDAINCVGGRQGGHGAIATINTRGAQRSANSNVKPEMQQNNVIYATVAGERGEIGWEGLPPKITSDKIGLCTELIG